MREAIELPSQKRLNYLFNYDALTGYLIWRPRPSGDFTDARYANTWNTRFSGKAAGYVNRDGYRQIKVDGISYLSHRLIWAINHGRCPNFLDHINGNSRDDRIENLRPATRQENSRNIGLRVHNTSGATGVHQRKRDQRWLARIKISGRDIYLGDFEDFEDAVEARKAAEIKYFAEFRRDIHPIKLLEPQ